MAEQKPPRVFLYRHPEHHHEVLLALPEHKAVIIPKLTLPQALTHVSSVIGKEPRSGDILVLFGVLALGNLGLIDILCG